MENFTSPNQELYTKEDSLKIPAFFRTYIFKIICLVVLIFLAYFLFISPPKAFPAGSIVNIKEGASLRSVSQKLKNENIIRSTVFFEAFIVIYGGEKHIIPTDYFFESKLPAFEIARRILKGEHHLAPIKVTIPEGFNNIEIAESFSAKLPKFDKGKFLTAVKEKEGYLFPDTYFFFTTDDEANVIKSMTNNFEKKMLEVRPKIATSGKTEKSILVMASIIEREAKGDGDRGFISGILWKRFDIGMPLQADAAPITYKEKGLPASPIGNPGLEAINAAISPEKSSYLYYLHDKEGVIHYAKNFQEHRANILKYLK